MIRRRSPRAVVVAALWIATFGVAALLATARSWPEPALWGGALALATGTALAGRRHLNVLRVGAATVSVPAMSVGHGLGWLRLQAAGGSPRTALALTTLVAGSGLLAWAVLDLLRRAGGRLLWIAAPVAVAGLVLHARQVVWPLSHAVAFLDGPRYELDGALPPPALGAVEVTYEATDGLRLSGWYVPSRNGAAVVVAPGGFSNRTSSMRQAELLARHGFGVLVYDARGQGESDGIAMGLGWHGDHDLRGALDFVGGQPDVEPGRIGVLGLSMGGEQAIGAAGADRRVCAVVADGASYRVLGDTTPASHGAVLDRWRERLMFSFVDLVATVDPPPTLTTSIGAIAPRRALLIATGHGEEQAAAVAMEDVAPQNVSVWMVPDVGHLEAITAHPREYEQRVVEFFDRELATGRGGCRAR